MPALPASVPQMISRAHPEDKYCASLDYAPRCNNGDATTWQLESRNTSINLKRMPSLCTPETSFLPMQLGGFDDPRQRSDFSIRSMEGTARTSNVLRLDLFIGSCAR